MVKPIKNLNIFNDILIYLHNKKIRDFMLIFLGVNTGLRISDLIKLTIFDIGEDYINIKCDKNNEYINIPVLEHVKKEIENYIKLIPNNLYLFTPKNKDKPLSRQRAYEILKNIEIKFKLDNLGTHSLRKTFGYHFYKNTNDIATLMIILGHEREKDTLKYIGIEQDRIDSKMKEWGGIKYKKFKVVSWTK